MARHSIADRRQDPRYARRGHAPPRQGAARLVRSIEWWRTRSLRRSRRSDGTAAWCCFRCGWTTRCSAQASLGGQAVRLPQPRRLPRLARSRRPLESPRAGRDVHSRRPADDPRRPSEYKAPEKTEEAAPDVKPSSRSRRDCPARFSRSGHGAELSCLRRRRTTSPQRWSPRCS